MQDRILNSQRIEFRKKKWTGKNECGMRPVGDMALILVDAAMEETAGGIIIPGTSIEVQQMAAESGTIVGLGSNAFYWNSDRSRPWVGDDKPVVGDHIIFSRYAGKEIFGNDGNFYRLVLDKEIGGIATDAGFFGVGKIAEAEQKAEETLKEAGITPFKAGAKSVKFKG